MTDRLDRVQAAVRVGELARLRERLGRRRRRARVGIALVPYVARALSGIERLAHVLLVGPDDDRRLPRPEQISDGGRVDDRAAVELGTRDVVPRDGVRRRV